MRLGRQSLIPVFTLIAACSQAQVLTGPMPVAPTAVVVDFGATHGRTAVLSVAPPVNVLAPGRYHVQTASTVHHWVAADIAEYDVTLEVRVGGTYTTIGSGITAVLPTSGPSAATQATFANLSQGAYYRAFVTAKGNVNASDNSLTLDATPATVDFDFTATQDVATNLAETATIVFDSVGFSGTGTLAFGSPVDGGYAVPTALPLVTGNRPPLPYTQLANQTYGIGVAVDPNTHNVWATNYNLGSVTELTSTGSVLATFSVGSNPAGVAVDPTNDHVWVANEISSSVTELTSTGSVLGTFTSGMSAPLGVVVDPNTEHVWVTNEGSNKVTELTSTGSVLGSFFAGSSSGPFGVAVDRINDHVWIALNGTSKVLELTSTGSVLGSFSVGSNTLPYGVAVDPTNEHVWVANTNTNNVVELTSTGSVLGTFNVTYAPTGVAVDARNGNVWVANSSDNSVTELSSTGSVLGTFTVGISQPEGLAVDPGTGHVWLTHNGNT